MSSIAAVDLGATSGRVIVGGVQDGTLRMRTVARFPNTPVRLADGLHWDVLGLYAAAMRGLGTAAREEPELTGAAIDSWAVDYGLLRGPSLLGNPFHYRDDRTAAGVRSVHAVVGPDELFRRNGLQHLPFNTVFQLAASEAAGELETADRLLLIPDLLGYWATGAQVAERTNASTTGLVPVGGADWDRDLLPRLGLRPDLFPAIVEPGTDLGAVTAAMQQEFGIPASVRFTTVGSHDTASAIVGTPLGRDSAYISCGTWSLVGAELASPVTSDAARLAGFTNEGGVDGRTRFLKNVMGLWLLSESIRAWEKVGETYELTALLGLAAEADTDVPTFDANDPSLLAPGDMPGRIEALVAASGSRPYSSIPEFVRGVLQSLANAYAEAIDDVERLTGTRVRTVHLTGGGAQNALLCRLTADTLGRPVAAGPIEATAIGNLLVQARTHGDVPGDLGALREVVVRSFPPRVYEPRSVRTSKG